MRPPRLGKSRRSNRFPGRASRPSVEAMERRELLATGPTIWTVNSLTDVGRGKGQSGDLLYCILKADADDNPAGDTIEFSTKVFNKPKTITVVDGELHLSNPLGTQIITGGKSKVTIAGSTTHGSGSVLGVLQGVSAQIYSLTITGGNSQTNGGGVANDGSLSIVGSTITGNTVTTLAAQGGGGGIDNGPDGTLTIYQTTVAGNSTDPGDAALDDSGGGILNDGILSIFDSTVSGNTAADMGGGVANSGTGLLAMVNDTVTANSSGFGGGGVYNLGGLTAINSTIVSNSSIQQGPPIGGGLLNDVGGTLILQNSIVSQNSDIFETVESPDDIMNLSTILLADSGDNLIGVISGASDGLANGVDGNIVGVTDPMLGPLANNGGPTETMAELAGSPALGAGNAAYVNDLLFFGPPPTDQRGSGYNRIVDGLVDIGAYQDQAES